ncbi:MAG: ATP-binding protein [Candidatus Obscuribacterales bacterium]|nr:ATP-binding protein [Candidatus Obscuribacterales bacterium]
MIGGPNIGKTKQISLLRKRGFKTINEKATEVIQEGKLCPVINPIGFRREVVIRQQEHEVAIAMSGTKFVFTDRGAYDGRYYCEATGCEEPSFLADLPNGLVQYAFVLAPVPWEEDGIRYEDPAFTLRVNPIARRVYEETGARVFDIPLLPTPEDRVEMILSVLRNENVI